MIDEERKAESCERPSKEEDFEFIKSNNAN
jgi:hypothetical protein